MDNMINKRHSLYSKVRVDSIEEFDFLSSNLTFLDMDDSKTFRIPRFAEGRPDLISHLVYESTDYWWLILYHNDIIDPIEELTANRLLDIPSLNDYYDFHNQNAKRGRRG